MNRYKHFFLFSSLPGAFSLVKCKPFDDNSSSESCRLSRYTRSYSDLSKEEWEYFYNFSGNICRISSIDVHGRASSALFEYNDYNYLSGITFIDGFNKYQGYKAEYNDSGLLISESVFDSSGSWVHHALYEYNNKGFVTKQILYYDHLNPRNILTVTFAYDRPGNVIQCMYPPSGLLDVYNRYEYNSNGSISSFLNSIDGCSITKTISYIYDSRGFPVKELVDGFVDKKYINEYNEKGYRIKTSGSRANGSGYCDTFEYESSPWLAKFCGSFSFFSPEVPAACAYDLRALY
ncbi:MAG: hypothetical protein GY754_41185 [bacterium]|nr:hypothetical protein [bacterium]